MTGREKRALRNAFVKFLSAAVAAAGLAGMYGMRAGAVQAPAESGASVTEKETAGLTTSVRMEPTSCRVLTGSGRTL